jgi:ferric-dicitrate binding protein FerR (iron transport regulator)
MAQHKKSLDQLLQKFLNRTARQEETLSLWRWLWQLDAEEPESKVDTGRQERLWMAITAQTQAAAPPRKRIHRKYLVMAAAVLFCFIAIPWLLLKPRKEAIQNYVIASDDHHIKSVILPDGTTVILNLSSSLTYPSDYNQKERRVTLIGEGYFKVTTNGQRPFIVQSGGLETQVLGTAFNIEAHNNSAQTRIALTSGKILVYPIHRPQQKKLLEPGQLLRYDPATGAIATRTFTINAASWTTGGLSFNGIPLSEALRKLEQHYHIHLQYRESQLTGKTVTAAMDKTSWQNALSAILFPHDLTYKVKNGMVIIQ